MVATLKICTGITSFAVNFWDISEIFLSIWPLTVKKSSKVIKSQKL